MERNSWMKETQFNMQNPYKTGIHSIQKWLPPLNFFTGMGSASIGDSNILPELCGPPTQILLLSPSHALATQSAAGHWGHLTCTNFSICLPCIKASYKKPTTVLCLQGTHLCSLQASLFSHLPALSCSSRNSSWQAMYTAVQRWHSFSFITQALLLQTSIEA